MMRPSEIHKFCDATLRRTLEGLKSYYNDVKYGYVQKELTNDEVEFLKLFEEDIEVRLNYRDQMRRWEILWCSKNVEFGNYIYLLCMGENAAVFVRLNKLCVVPDAYTYPPLPRVPLYFQASACSLSTLHFLKLPENSFDVLQLLENSVEVLKILENKLESMKILENKLESLKLQENQPARIRRIFLMDTAYWSSE
ncbi:hypothetical protein Tco_0481879 [Tanacetum coccineum]